MILKDKVAFINGGARIGVTIAEELARRGCHIALSYRSSHKSTQEALTKAARFGVQTSMLQGDMTVIADVKRVISKIRSVFGRLDVVINMASQYERSPFGRLDNQTWESNMKANLKSAFLTVQRAAPLLRRRGGRVINYADWVAASGRPRYKDFLPYYTAKAGIIGLTQAQALELAPNVLVNAIAPGPILPPPGISKEEVRDVTHVTPLKKWGGPLEIAKATIFLCETEFVTGECLRVDGGRHLY